MIRANRFEGVNSIKINKHFQSDEDCCKYLSEIKWSYVNGMEIQLSERALNHFQGDVITAQMKLREQQDEMK
ncbi:MAG TPA: hypothetical protein GXX42_05625 [Petrimonas sp.]|uniref:hypothetical protein n=1 Tax=Petrimonas sp. TaxID=2023866 RepID=UPI001754E188|nr:hypothetical protein [Petrimonas sp.]